MKAPHMLTYIPRPLLHELSFYFFVVFFSHKLYLSLISKWQDHHLGKIRHSFREKYQLWYMFQHEAEHWTEIVCVVFEWNYLTSLWLMLNDNNFLASVAISKPWKEVWIDRPEPRLFSTASVFIFIILFVSQNDYILSLCERLHAKRDSLTLCLAEIHMERKAEWKVLSYLSTVRVTPTLTYMWCYVTTTQNVSRRVTEALC